MKRKKKNKIKLMKYLKKSENSLSSQKTWVYTESTFTKFVNLTYPRRNRSQCGVGKMCYQFN